MELKLIWNVSRTLLLVKRNLNHKKIIKTKKSRNSFKDYIWITPWNKLWMFWRNMRKNMIRNKKWRLNRLITKKRLFKRISLYNLDIISVFMVWAIKKKSLARILIKSMKKKKLSSKLKDTINLCYLPISCSKYCYLLNVSIVVRVLLTKSNQKNLRNYIIFLIPCRNRSWKSLTTENWVFCLFFII